MAPDDAALVALEHTVAEVCLFEWPSSSANGVHESLGIGEAGLQHQQQAAEVEVRPGLAAAEEADLRHQLQAAQAEARQGLAAAAAAEAASAVQRESAAGLAAEAARAQDEAVAVVRAEMDEMEARLTDATAEAVAAAEARVEEQALAARTEAVAEAVAAQAAAPRRSSVDLDDLVAYTDLVHANTGLAADTIVVEADSSAATLSDMVEAARVAQEKAVAEAVAAVRAENAAQAQEAGASSVAQGQLDWAQAQLEQLEMQAEELRAENETVAATMLEERRQHRLALQDAEKELQLVRAGAASAVAAAEKALLEARREAAREAASRGEGEGGAPLAAPAAPTHRGDEGEGEGEDEDEGEGEDAPGAALEVDRRTSGGSALRAQIKQMGDSAADADRARAVALRESAKARATIAILQARLTESDELVAELEGRCERAESAAAREAEQLAQDLFAQERGSVQAAAAEMRKREARMVENQNMLIAELSELQGLLQAEEPLGEALVRMANEKQRAEAALAPVARVARENEEQQKELLAENDRLRARNATLLERERVRRQANTAPSRLYTAH